MLTLYGYIGISYVIIRFLSEEVHDMGAIYLGLMYFIASGVVMIVFLTRMNKKLKLNDSL
jgi:hypothetical protein